MLRIVILFIASSISFSVTSYETGETVLLKYVAEPGVTYFEEIEAEILKVKSGIESLERSVSGKTRIQLVEHSEGILVRGDLVYYSVETEDSDMKEYMDPFYEKLQPDSMSVVVSDLGKFLRLEGAQPELESSWRSVDDLIENSPDELRSMLSSLAETWLSEEVILAQSKQNWILVVEQWIGAEFEKGYEYQIAYLDEVPEFANVKLAFDGKYQYLGKVPCNDIDNDLSCVELYFQSSLKPESAKALTEALTTDPNLVIDDKNMVALNLGLRMITEQSTLKAHQYERIKTIWVPDDNGLSWTEHIEKMNITYNYD